MWTSDGTADGTSVLQRFLGGPGDLSYEQARLTVVNGAAYFTVNQELGGGGLWRTDGTLAGTVMVSAYSGPSAFIGQLLGALGPELVFSANDGIHGSEPWITDGTSPGTHLLKDLAVSYSPLHPEWLTTVNGTLYFAGYDPESISHGLWRSDGTASGTVRVSDAPATHLVAAGNRLFFVGQVSGGLWTSDGTPAGTVELPTVGGTAFPIGVLNGTLYLIVYDPRFGMDALWKSDGTPAGTSRVSSQTFRDFAGQPDVLRSLSTGRESGGLLYFGASTSSSSDLDLWRTDGTDEGTLQLTGPINSQFPYELPSLIDGGGGLYFTVGTSIWRSDGAAAGTTVVRSFKSIEQFFYANGTLYLVADDGTHGPSLWTADSTFSNLTLLKSYTAGSVPTFVLPEGNDLFFELPRGRFQFLWRLDLTSGDAVPLRPIGQSYLFPQFLTANNELLYFDGDRLWRSDGTPDGTVQVDGTYDNAPLTQIGPAAVVVGDRVYYAVPSADGLHDELHVASTMAPSAPAGLALSAMYPAAPAPPMIALSWSAASANAVSYVIEKSAQADFSTLNSVVFVPAGTTTYTESFSPGAPMLYYRVRAIDAGGNSGYSNAVSFGALITATPGIANTVTLRRDADGIHDDIWLNASTSLPPSLVADLSEPITIASGGLTDTLVIDGPGGDALPRQLVLAGNFTLSSLVIGPGGSVVARGAGATLTVTSLSIDPAGALDIQGNELDVEYANGASPNPSIRAWVLDGRKGLGGIVSSNAYSYEVVGYLDNAAAGVERVRTTLPGDTNLDGVVNFRDFILLAAHFFQRDADWFTGDFNGDGVVNFADYKLLSNYFGLTAPRLPITASLTSAAARKTASAVMAASSRATSGADGTSQARIRVDDGDSAADALVSDDETPRRRSGRRSRS